MGSLPIFSFSDLNTGIMLRAHWLISTLCLVLCTGAAALQNPGSPAPPTYRWAIGKGSTLRIAGSSNVNKFTCAIPGYNAPDTLACAADGGNVRLNGHLEIDVLAFDCGNKLITKDLRKTLRQESYPKLYVRFLTIESMPSGMGGQTKGWVEVELAGRSKTFQLSYHIEKGPDGMLLLKGSRIFCFSDFRLAPPKKLAGLIRIRDEFAVDFSLQLIPVKS